MELRGYTAGGGKGATPPPIGMGKSSQGRGVRWIIRSDKIRAQEHAQAGGVMHEVYLHQGLHLGNPQ